MADLPTSVGAALALARGRLPASETRLLLREILGCTAAQLAAYPERALAAGQAGRFVELLTRRVAGEPVAYLLGEREFYGRRFGVSPAVLIPRPETELVVDLVLARVAPGSAPAILDLGTGSGALAVTLALEIPAAQVTAVDFSPSALIVARANAAALAASVRCVESDWFAALDTAAGFDFIVSNPPYIAENDPHLPALRHEPTLALTSGADGLTAIRQIVADAPAHLHPQGWLLLEHGHAQGPAVADLFRQAGWRGIDRRTDLAGHWRCTGAQRPLS